MFRAAAVKKAAAFSFPGRRIVLALWYSADRVDDALRPGQRLCETLPGEDVHAGCTRHRDHFVPSRLQHVHYVPADAPGPAGHRNLHVFLLLP
jgi:hypothetical protein